MSFLLDCPHCGARDVNEFRYQGEVTRRPKPEPTLRDLTEYVYFRDNVAGVQREWWYHRLGCGIWFVAERDWLSVVDRIGGPFTPVGFYYRTMIRPRRLWPVYEKFLRNVAGLGRVDKHGSRVHRYDTEHRAVGVLVIGGGRSGLRAAREAAQRGEDVLVGDENPA